MAKYILRSPCVTHADTEKKELCHFDWLKVVIGFAIFCH